MTCPVALHYSNLQIWQISFFQMHQCFSRTWCLPKLNSLKSNIVLSKTANFWFKSGNIWSKNKTFSGNFASFQYSVIRKLFGKYSKMILVNILTCRRHKQTKLRMNWVPSLELSRWICYEASETKSLLTLIPVRLHAKQALVKSGLTCWAGVRWQSAQWS